MAKKKAKTNRAARKVTNARSAGSTSTKRPTHRISKPTVKPDLADQKQPGGISSAAVERATGKGWSEWCRLLDKEGAKKMNHKEIAQLLHGKYAVGDWWSQMVTVGYEQARGLRKPHETPRGFQASASKTINVSLSKLFNSWSSSAERAPWFEPADLNISKETRDKSMRVLWPDGTRVEINFYAKGPSKSQVALQHNRLKSEADVARMKKFWTAALGRLKTRLE